MPPAPQPLRGFRVLLIPVLAAATLPLGARAQPLGAFRWQLQPFCNVVTLAVRQDGAVYTLDGTDDRCGAAAAGAVTGTAFLNPDGSIGLGLSGVLGDNAAPVTTYARVDLSTVNGTWADSAGNAGTFAFTSGPGTGGSPRPVPPNGVRPQSVTADQLVPGAVGAVHIAAGSITAAQLALGAITGAHLAPGTITAAHLAPGTVQPPILGTCPVGRYLRGVTVGGAVICEPFYMPTLSTTVDDPPNSVGAYTSIAIGTDGLPVISHRHAEGGGLRITKCGNPSCTAGNASRSLSPGGTVAGYYTSLAIGTNGFPVVSHWDQTLEALRVTACADAVCASGEVSPTVDDPADAVGLYTSIAIGTDGRPVVSHWNATAFALRVTKCGNAECTAGNVSTTVDDPANLVGLYTSIAVPADGRPVISYMDFTAGGLRVTKCGNAACTAGNVSTTVDDPANAVGLHTSLAIGLDGLPVISHQDQTAGALRVTKCGNAACTAGNVSTTVDAPGAVVGQFSRMAIGADGLPVISHQDQTAGALRVTKCGNAACTAGNVSTTVDEPANSVGGHSSIAIGSDGLPVISHQDGTAAALRVTRCGTQTCR